MLKVLFSLAVFAFWGGPVAGAQTPRKIMVIAPHPDDEALMSAGVIHQSVLRGENVTVVVVTNGDARQKVATPGLLRERETVEAMRKLGLKEDQIVFLGYGDDSLMGLFRDPSPAAIHHSPAGRMETYGDRGLGGKDFHSSTTGRPAAYTRENVLKDFASILRMFKPDDVFTTSRFDAHPDHQATFLFLQAAMQNLKSPPTVHQAIVHAPNWSHWPDAASSALTEPLGFAVTSLSWKKREALPLPADMLNSDLKADVIKTYVSQDLTKNQNYAKTNEVFWTDDSAGNLALLAQVRASSENPGARQFAYSALDGIANGCPPFCEHEWVTDHPGRQASLDLYWDQPVLGKDIVLTDRSEEKDRFQSAEILLDDAAVVVAVKPVGERKLQLTLPGRKFKHLRVVIRAESTRQLGLAEAEVHGG